MSPVSCPPPVHGTKRVTVRRTQIQTFTLTHLLIHMYTHTQTQAQTHTHTHTGTGTDTCARISAPSHSCHALSESPGGQHRQCCLYPSLNSKQNRKHKQPKPPTKTQVGPIIGWCCCKCSELEVEKHNNRFLATASPTVVFSPSRCCLTLLACLLQCVAFGCVKGAYMAGAWTARLQPSSSREHCVHMHTSSSLTD